MYISPLDSAIFGDLYGSAEMRAIFSDSARLQSMLDVEAALARAEAKVGIVPVEVADAVSAAATVSNINIDAIAEGTRKVGYPVVALVRELRRAAGERAARYIHHGATTQDILDTAQVLQMREAICVVRRDLLALAQSLAQHAARFRDAPMAGRTHLQHAVPVTFGFKCAVWASPVIKDLSRLDEASKRSLVVQFGGAAGTLASLGSHGPAVRRALAEELGLGVCDIPWHVTRDNLAEIVSVLGIICGNLSKFAVDITLLMQTEVAEVFEPHEAGRGGSSTMPQKRNPIAAEYIIACARAVHGMVAVMMGAMAQDHERATGPWQTEALMLPQCFALTAGALAHARSIAEGMTVDTARMRRNLDAGLGLIMAESVANGLTPVLGSEAAHHAVERACTRAIDENRTLREVLSDDPQIRAHLNDEQLDRLVDPASYLGSAGTFVDSVVARVAGLK